MARAFDWQSKGHRFDSDILHKRGSNEPLFLFYNIRKFNVLQMLLFFCARVICATSVISVVQFLREKKMTNYTALKYNHMVMSERYTLKDSTVTE